jgi:DNA invertase Pin-like site-specific DNA recombinase
VKLIAYTRVSSERQAEKGEGLDIQRDIIRRWSAEHGHRIVAGYSDEGVSGVIDLEHRIGLAGALEDLRRGRAEGIVVHRLDRLARDLVVQETILREILRIGATPYTTSPAETHFLGDDPNDPTRRLVRQVLGAISDYERSLVALRMRNGRERKAAAGGYAHGAPPYGWRAVKGSLEPNEAEQRVLATMKRLHAQGHSTRSICRALMEAGCTPRRGKAFHPRVVGRILARQQIGTKRKS